MFHRCLCRDGIGRSRGRILFVQRRRSEESRLHRHQLTHASVYRRQLDRYHARDLDLHALISDVAQDIFGVALLWWSITATAAGAVAHDIVFAELHGYLRWQLRRI